MHVHYFFNHDTPRDNEAYLHGEEKNPAVAGTEDHEAIMWMCVMQKNNLRDSYNGRMAGASICFLKKM